MVPQLYVLAIFEDGFPLELVRPHGFAQLASQPYGVVFSLESCVNKAASDQSTRFRQDIRAMPLQDAVAAGLFEPVAPEE